jgi:hypothetical protein
LDADRSEERQARGGRPGSGLAAGRREDPALQPAARRSIVHAAAYFASDDSAVITGSVLDLEQLAIGAPGTW